MDSMYYQKTLQRVFKCDREEHGADSDYYNGIILASENHSMDFDPTRYGFCIGWVSAFIKLAIDKLLERNGADLCIKDKLQVCQLYLSDCSLDGINKCLENINLILDSVEFDRD